MAGVAGSEEAFQGDGRADPEFVLDPDASGAVPGPTRPGGARRLNRLACVAAIVATVAVPVGLRAWGRLGDPSDGALSAPNSPRWTAAGVTLARVEGAAGGLRAGDVVTGVEGIPLDDWVRDRDHRPSRRLAPGDRLTYQVRRDGQALDISVVLREYAFKDAISGNSSTLPLVVLVLAVAVFVYVSRPRDRLAQVLLAVAALIAFGVGAAPYVQVVDLLVPYGVGPFVAERFAVATMWGALCHFALVFPEPWLPRRRRWAVVAAYSGPFLLYALYLARVLPASDGPLARLGALVSVSFASSRAYPFVVATVIVLASRSALIPENRQRMKWVMRTFLASLAVFMAVGQVPSLVLQRPLVSERWLALVFLPCPVVIGASILRYRIFDLQVILKRSLLYGSLTGGVFGLYFAALALATRSVDLSKAGVTLFGSAVVAVCVPFLRDRLRRTVSRVVYGDRDDPHEVVSRLGRRLEDTARAEGILPGVVDTLALTLRLPYAAIELHNAEGAVEASASFGTSRGAPLVIGLAHRGEMVGRLMLEVRSAAEPFGPADRRLLEEVGRQVAATAHEVLLHSALQRSLVRLVNAREEERRRLHRDLHDGLGPTLAAGALQLSVARGLVRDDAEGAESLIDRVTAEVQSAISDIRGLVRGLRPAMLDEFGLVDAIRHRAADLTGNGAGSALRDVRVEAEGDFQLLPAAVEVAAYCIVMEALNNAFTHGHATLCTVSLVVGRSLDLRVRDNGRGLPSQFSPGVGLGSMRERAAELGGTCEIQRGPDGGTVVHATLPIEGA